jgi:hypothetical protein
LFFPTTGAVLEAVRIEMDDALVADWRRNVAEARRHLDWDPEAACVARHHASGVSLALAAPLDRLFTATELNEWALCAALHDRDPMHWSGLRDALRASAEQSGPSPSSAHPAEIDRPAAFARLTSLAAQERRPGLLALAQEARDRALAAVIDDQVVTLGSGATGRSYDVADLPASPGRSCRRCRRRS